MQGLFAFFDWILMSSLMGSILIVLILLAKFAFQNKAGANWHYYIWFLLLLRLMVPFTPESPISIYNLIINEHQQIVFSNHSSSETINPPVVASKTASYSAANRNYPGQLHTGEVNLNVVDNATLLDFNDFNCKAVLILLWLVGAALLAGYTVFINFRIWYQIRNEPQLNNAPISDILRSCQSVMNISKDIPIVATDIIHTPALFGLIKPRLLLPASIINKLTDDQFKYICLHELAHWKRKDIMINWITVILKILHWFNPVIWYGFHRMHQDCELACDSLVLSSIEPAEHKEYGYTVIRVLQMTLTQQWIPGATGMLTGKSHITRRITMISNFKKQSLSFTVAALIIFVGIGAVGCTDARNVDSLQPGANLNGGSYNQITSIESDTNRILAGAVDVEGPGIIVTLSDRKTNNDQDPDFLVHDYDIREIVNQLTAAEAEAISVNDERLITTTAIGCIEDKILINNNTYNSPFIIKAIGNSEKMEQALQSRGGHIEMLRLFGMGLAIERSDKLLIPKYTGEVIIKYAKCKSDWRRKLRDNMILNSPEEDEGINFSLNGV
ncbi:MAG: M56 family metallopeptidase [Syntrophomonadaceae bacterium]